jgi:hypothetical protein
MITKLNLSILAALTVMLAGAPMIASADATTTGSESTLSSPLSFEHGVHHHHHHHPHHRHRH